MRRGTSPLITPNRDTAWEERKVEFRQANQLTVIISCLSFLSGQCWGRSHLRRPLFLCFCIKSRKRTVKKDPEYPNPSALLGGIQSTQGRTQGLGIQQFRSKAGNLRPPSHGQTLHTEQADTAFPVTSFPRAEETEGQVWSFLPLASFAVDWWHHGGADLSLLRSLKTLLFRQKVRRHGKTKLILMFLQVFFGVSRCCSSLNKNTMLGKWKAENMKLECAHLYPHQAGAHCWLTQQKWCAVNLL